MNITPTIEFTTPSGAVGEVTFTAEVTYSYTPGTRSTRSLAAPMGYPGDAADVVFDEFWVTKVEQPPGRDAQALMGFWVIFHYGLCGRHASTLRDLFPADWDVTGLPTEETMAEAAILDACENPDH